MDTPFDNVFHQKVASESNSEVLLFTKKSSGLDLKNPLDFLKQKSILNRKSFETNSLTDDDKPKTSKSSPSYTIEFNIDNKLEMVQKKSIEKNDTDSEENYCK